MQLVALVAFLAVLFTSMLLVKSYLVRRELSDLREDLRSLQTRLQTTDQRHDRMFDEIETLIGRMHANETRNRMLVEQLMNLHDLIEGSRPLASPEPPEALEAPDSKPGRTVYDHLMADDDPDVS